MGHNGVVAIKAEAWQNICWPNINSDIEEAVKGCNQCCSSNKQVSILKLKLQNPNKPWSRHHIDYCVPIEGNFFLIIIDAFSKFMDVHIVSSINSKITIECLRKSFANFGILDDIV